jgi:hypothetical protein
MSWPPGDEEESLPSVSLGRRRRIVCAASVSLAIVIAFVALSDVAAPASTSKGAASMLVQTEGAWGRHDTMKPYTKQELSAAETGMAAAAAALQYIKPTQTEQLSSAPISGTPSTLHRKMADVWAERTGWQPRQVTVPAAVPYAGLSTISGTPSTLHRKMADVWAERPNQPRQVAVPAVSAAAAVTEEQEQQDEQEKQDAQDVQEQQEQQQEEQEQQQEQQQEPSAPAPRSDVAGSGDAADGQAAAGQENVVAGENEGGAMRKSPLEAAVDAAEAEEASEVRARAERQQQQQDKAWEMEEEEEKHEKEEEEQDQEQEQEKEKESAISSQQPEAHPLADTPRFASPPSSAGTPYPPYFFSSREGTHIVEQPLAPGEPYSVTGGFIEPVAEASPASEEGEQQPVYYPAPRRYVRVTPTSSSNDDAVSDGVKPSAATQTPSQSHGGLSSAEKAYIKKAVSDALERRRGQGSQGGWSYSPQAANGPSRWAQVGYPKCGEGVRQSPINIEDGVRAADMPTLAWQVPVESKQGGGSIVAIQDGAIEVSGLDGLFSYGGAEYGLASARVHTPSEHAIGGVKLDMEVQFVHR